MLIYLCVNSAFGSVASLILGFSEAALCVNYAFGSVASLDFGLFVGCLSFTDQTNGATNRAATDI